jgi:predicted nucleic acid-binding Zn ribbon protein
VNKRGWSRLPRESKPREPRSAEVLISHIIARRGFTQQLFNDELHRAWSQAAGSEFAAKTTATRIRRGVLEVLVDSSPALQQLAFRKSELLERMQTAMPAAGLRGLVFRIGVVRRPQSPPKPD